MKLTKLTEKKKLMLISATCVIALAVILWPLLAISKYNYASADDWSYGVHTYQVIQNHGGVIAFIQAIIETVQESFWEARFANIALATLQPGIFGERCYSIVAYLMIGSIIFSEMYLLAQCIGKENRGLILPISIPMIMIQLLSVPRGELLLVYRGGKLYRNLQLISDIDRTGAEACHKRTEKGGQNPKSGNRLHFGNISGRRQPGDQLINLLSSGVIRNCIFSEK